MCCPRKRNNISIAIAIIHSITECLELRKILSISWYKSNNATLTNPPLAKIRDQFCLNKIPTKHNDGGNHIISRIGKSLFQLCSNIILLIITNNPKTNTHPKRKARNISVSGHFPTVWFLFAADCFPVIANL